MSFLLCLNASTIRPTPLLEKIQIASQAGYEGIELWNSEIEEYLHHGGTLRDLRLKIQDLGLTVPDTINLKGWFDAESLKDPAWDLCRQRMNHARELGAQFIVAGPPQNTTDWQRGVQNYAHLLQLGREEGIRPSMEFLGFVEQVFTLESALRITHEVADPDGTIVLDPFHIFRGGGSFDYVQHLKSSEISVCHLNDALTSIDRIQQSDADRVLPGDGDLPLVEMLGRLILLGYRGTLSLELFSPRLWERNPLEVAATGLQRMQSLVAQAESLAKTNTPLTS